MIMLTGKATIGQSRSRRNIRYEEIATVVQHPLQLGKS